MAVRPGCRISWSRRSMSGRPIPSAGLRRRDRLCSLARWPRLGIEADQVLRPWRDLDPPVVIAPSLRWTDHPWLLVSPDGKDVYVGLNMDDSPSWRRTTVADVWCAVQNQSADPRSVVGRKRRGHGAGRNAIFRGHQFLSDYRGPAEST